MLKPLLFLPVLFLIGAPALFQQAPPSASPAAAPQAYTIPPEYANKANPVTPTAQSQARAKQIYGWDCALCHGDNGNGKGDVAVSQKLDVPDLRNAATLKPYSDGQLFYIIRNGKGKMPGEGPRAKDDEVWNIIIYLHRMAGSPAAAPTPSATSPAQPPA